jgi:hypothetical protein
MPRPTAPEIWRGECEAINHEIGTSEPGLVGQEQADGATAGYCRAGRWASSATRSAAYFETPAVLMRFAMRQYYASPRYAAAAVQNSDREPRHKFALGQ